MSRLTTSRAGHAYALDGERIPSVTTIIGNATPKRALIGWAAREAAQWAATHVDLLPAIGEAEWVKQAAAAHTAAASKAALRGTDVHAFAHELVTTGTTDAPPEHVGIVEQAADFLDTWHVDEIAAERPCVNTDLKYGGTFDVLARLGDGRVWLLDWKTGKGPFTEQALQLAAYAACDFYVTEAGDDVPMPNIDALGFVMLADSSWDFVPVVADRTALMRVFARMRGISDFVEWTTPNRSGSSRWPVLGEPLPKSAAS